VGGQAGESDSKRVQHLGGREEDESYTTKFANVNVFSRYHPAGIVCV